MSIFDIAVLACLVPSAISGIKKGFITQISAIIAVVLGVWLSVLFADRLSIWMNGLFEANPGLLKTLAFIVIFVAVTVLLNLVGKLLEKVVKLAMLGWLNRLLGVVFAIMKWTLFLCIAVALFDSLNTCFHIVSAEKLDSSIFYGPLKEISSSVFPYLRTLLSGGNGASA